MQYCIINEMKTTRNSSKITPNAEKKEDEKFSTAINEMMEKFDKIVEEMRKTFLDQLKQIKSEITKDYNEKLEKLSVKVTTLEETVKENFRKVEILEKKVKIQDEKENLMFDFFERRSKLTISGIPESVDDSKEIILSKISNYVGFLRSEKLLFLSQKT